MVRFKDGGWTAGPDFRSNQECGVVIGQIRIAGRVPKLVEHVTIRCTKPKGHGEHSITDVADWDNIPERATAYDPEALRHEYRMSGMIIRRDQ